ncbi:MAG TPA: serine/threonine-protein kinase, partial [Anaerolineales bacterium]|nr:serine/threonine-protein kinase [Anaerolineales bacterium]
HILPLYEYGSEKNVRFMVSPYIPGGTLTARIKSPLSFEQVIKYGTEIASALDYLHQQGVIHRDLKSSNILLDLSDHTYLADFGLARIISDSTLAFHTGHGTPPYAPPEQIRSKEITAKSDIFSFGILLFEMLTGQLPWNGKRQLGVEQLHSDQQLPDPREYITGLPPLITDVLRRVTSANPDLRPRSGSEVMRMMHYVFNLPADSMSSKRPYDGSTSRSKDAEEILNSGLTQWESTDGKHNLGLTKFALINAEGIKSDTDVFNRFMLSQALTYGHYDDEWWSIVRNPRERLMVSSALLRKENEAITGRVLDRLTGDRHILSSSNGLPKNLANSLLALGTKTNDAILRQKIFTGLRILLRPGSVWKDPELDSNHIKRLGVLALEDSEFGDSAAELIGHIRSPSAVRVVLTHSNEGRKIDALLLIQKVAGSLPSLVPGPVRFRLSLERNLQRMTQRPVNLIGAYGTIFLGSALGVSLQVYLTYNLPTFMDVARIVASLFRGLIIGSILGLGIFLTRVIVERFHSSNTYLSLMLGTILGGLGINIAIFIFHMLFLGTPPQGVLITLGSLLIAFTFAIGGLIRPKLVKMLLSSVSVFISILGTWLIHLNLAASPVDLTPFFRYDPAWPLIQVVFTALSVSFLIGIFGNLIDLSLRNEHV